MSNRTLVAVALCVVLIAASPAIVRGVEHFKTFLSLTSLLNSCDGTGSPGC